VTLATAVNIVSVSCCEKHRNLLAVGVIQLIDVNVYYMPTLMMMEHYYILVTTNIHWLTIIHIHILYTLLLNLICNGLYLYM